MMKFVKFGAAIILVSLSYSSYSQGLAQGLSPVPGGMKGYSGGGSPYALLTHTGKGATSADISNVTTDAIDTTGANLIVLVASWYPNVTADVTVTDSKSNSWTGLTSQTFGTTQKVRIFYSLGPTVGTGHTFTVSGTTTYPDALVASFSGAAASAVFDVENGATGSGTTLATGSITPTQNNELIITGVSNGGSSSTIDSGMTVTDSVDNLAANHVAGGMAYKIQTTASAINPSWSWTTSSDAAVSIASFKAQ